MCKEGAPSKAFAQFTRVSWDAAPTYLKSAQCRFESDWGHRRRQVPAVMQSHVLDPGAVEQPLSFEGISKAGKELRESALFGGIEAGEDLSRGIEVVADPAARLVVTAGGDGEPNGSAVLLVGASHYKLVADESLDQR